MSFMCSSEINSGQKQLIDFIVIIYIYMYNWIIRKYIYIYYIIILNQ
jgi:hypothetical protein